MRHIQKKNLLKRFRDDKSGNFAMMFAVGMITILMATGFALDFGRAVSSQSSARDALDAAILATARQLSIGELDPDDAYDFLKNYLEGTLGQEIGEGKEYRISNFSIDETNEKITADLTRELPLTFMSVGGTRDSVHTAGSAALYGIDTTEVIMTFDVTGSMWGSKINDLKAAATSGLNDLMSGSAAENGKLRVGIVPYSEAVNTGPLDDTVFVETEDDNGTPPADTDPILIGSGSAPDKCSTERKGPNQFNDKNPSVAKINRDYRLNTCPTTEMIPLTTDKQKLLTAVNSLTTGGGTAGHIGIQWAWYLLSPKWANYVPSGSEPASYDEEAEVRKFAIIMTDGEFNVAYAGVNYNNSQYYQSTKSMKKAKKLCKKMKKKGIEIFTIGFALHDQDAKNMLKDCASPDTQDVTYYYEASGGVQLQKVYEDIATSIKELRLVR